MPKMNQFMAKLPSSHLILVRKKLSSGQCAALLLMRTPVRHYKQDRHFDSEKCAPATPLRRSRFLLYSAFAATLTGCAVVYAKHSQETRNFLVTNVPWADRFVAIVYQEEMTYYQFFAKQLDRAAMSVRNFVFGKDGVTPMDFKQRSEQDIEKDAIEAYKNREYKLPLTTLEPLYKEEIVVGIPEVEHKATLIQTELCEPQPPVKVNITKEVLDLEQQMHENTKIAMDEYKRALQMCVKYNKTLYSIVELPITELGHKTFGDLKGQRAERDKAIKTAKASSAKARCALETLERMISRTEVHAPPEHVYPTMRYIKQFRNDLAKAEADIEQGLENSVISDKYWDKVEAARMMYKEELMALFPNLDLSARKLDAVSETDLLLMYTMKQIQYLQNELAEMQTIREAKINKAIECHDEKALIEAKAEDMVKKERFEKDLEFHKKMLKIQADATLKMKAELRKQWEIQEDITKNKLNRLEQELQGKFNRRVSECIENERVIFKRELAAMAGKLQAIEQTLKQRAAAEAETRRSQSMWAAAEALLAATRRPGPKVKICNELSALAKAGQGDKLVKQVLEGIPQEVHDNGIFTEKCLKDRFENLEKTAMKVALIGREGASLPMYFLSWVQSKLLFQSLAQIPESELKNLPTDFTKLDTFDIIQRARYHLEHGDLPSALRYVNLLQGAPRAAATCWTEAARRHLEVRQAAETVMAHASLSGMLYL